MTCCIAVREDRRRRVGLADDHARLVHDRSVVDHAQCELRQVHLDVPLAEILRQPTPALHVGDDVGGRHGRAAPLGRAAMPRSSRPVGRRPCCFCHTARASESSSSNTSSAWAGRPSRTRSDGTRGSLMPTRSGGPPPPRALGHGPGAVAQLGKLLAQRPVAGMLRLVAGEATAASAESARAPSTSPGAGMSRSGVISEDRRVGRCARPWHPGRSHRRRRRAHSSASASHSGESPASLHACPARVGGGIEPIELRPSRPGA